MRPTSESFAAAAANAKWDAANGFYVRLTSQPAVAAWPIVGASFILVSTQPADAAKAKEVLNFFSYSFVQGLEAAARLHYGPLPENVIPQVRQAWSAIKGPNGRPIWK